MAEDGSMVPNSFYDDPMVRAEDGSVVPSSYYSGGAGSGLTMSAQEFSNLSDEARYAVPIRMLPEAPTGKKWTEDRTLVDADF